MEGYIVGYYDNTWHNVTFELPQSEKTNIILSNEKYATQDYYCIAVELPAGAIQNALNLVDNPGLMNQKILIRGDLASYLNRAGIKGVSEYKINTRSK